MQRIVLATNNKGKIREFCEFLSPPRFSLTLIPQSQLKVDDIEETGLSFVENALLKARHASSVTKLPAIADDSGLVIPFLNGAPGIYSARFAGKGTRDKDNLEKVLFELDHIPDEKRNAHFHCTLVFMLHENDPDPLICEGKWNGLITKAPIGEKGFGYDPIFYIPEEKKTAAEIPIEQKNKISHRGLALQLLLKRLPEKL